MTGTEYEILKITDPVAKEAYKVLRANIQFCEFSKRIKTLTITSCLPGEGKTTVSLNLGVSIATAGMKVLVVDADLRKPMLLKYMGNSNFKGLSNYISGHAELDEIINNTDIAGLYYIACGVKPPNPTELISSGRFSEFLEEVKERFDIVIIDTPPLGNVIDCAIIAAQTDGTILVIQHKAVDYRSAQMVKNQLEKANAHILGVVLNKEPGSNHKRGYDYYNFYGDGRMLGRKWLHKHKSIKKDKKND
jgi:protein-tyrosine kinase